MVRPGKMWSQKKGRLRAAIPVTNDSLNASAFLGGCAFMALKKMAFFMTRLALAFAGGMGILSSLS